MSNHGCLICYNSDFTNVNGLRDNTKRRKIFNFVNNTDHNIFLSKRNTQTPTQ